MDFLGTLQIEALGIFQIHMKKGVHRSCARAFWWLVWIYYNTGKHPYAIYVCTSSVPCSWYMYSCGKTAAVQKKVREQATSNWKEHILVTLVMSKCRIWDLIIRTNLAEKAFLLLLGIQTCSIIFPNVGCFFFLRAIHPSHGPVRVMNNGVVNPVSPC